MNLIPASEFLNDIGEAALSDAFIAEGGKPGFRTEAVIRRIQANALRWAAQRSFDGIQGDREIHDDLLEQANQLDSPA